MAGYAVSGFIDGFFRGRDWRDAKEDRKLDRERQKRLDAMNEQLHNLRLQEFGLREQEFGMRRDAYDREVSEYERQQALREQELAYAAQEAASMEAVRKTAELGVASGTGAARPGDFAIGRPQGQPAPAPVAPTQPAAPASPRLGFGVSDTAPVAPPSLPGAVAPAATQPVPPQAAANLPPEGLQITNVQPVQGTLPPSAPDSAPPLLNRNPDGTLTAARPPRTAEEKAVLAEAARSGALTMPKETPAQPDRRAMPPAQAGQPALDAATGLPMAVTPPRAENLTPGKPPQGPNVAEEIAQGTAPARNFVLGGIDRAIGLGVGAAEAAVGGISAAAGAGASALGMPRAGQQLFDIAGQRFNDAGKLAQQGYIGANTAAARETAAPQATETPSSPSAAAVSTLEQGAATSPETQQSAQATTTVATQAALSFGVRGSDNPKAEKTAAQAVVDHFYEVLAPRRVEFELSRGNVEGAKAYIDLIESRAGKEALQLQGRALFKFVNGDIDGALETAVKAAKAYGIVDSTFDVDEELSGVMRDEQGGFAGIRVAFKDRKTGDTMERVFDDVNSGIDWINTMLDPGNINERLMEMRKAQEAGAMNDVQKQIFDNAQTIFANSKDGMGVATKTWEQALQEAAAGVAAVTGQVPSGLGTLGAGAAPAIDPRITGAGPDGLYRMQ